MKYSGLNKILAWCARPTTAASLLVAGFLTALVTTAWQYYQNQQRALEQAKQEELTAIATLRVSEIANWRSERLADATVLMHSAPISRALHEFLSGSATDAMKESLLLWLAAYRDHSAYARILLLDSNLNVRLAVPAGENWLGPIAAGLAAQAVEAQQAFISDLHVSQVSGRVNMDLLVPLTVDAHALAPTHGVILLEMDPHEFLFPILKNWPTPSKTAETVLLREEGEEIVCLNELRHATNTAVRLRATLSDLVEPKKAGKALRLGGLLRCPDYRQVPVIAAVRPVPDSSWVVVAKQDESEVYAPIRKQALSTVATTGAVGLAGLLGVMLLRRNQKYESSLRELRTRRKSEETLRQSLKRFHSFTASAFEGICLHENTRIIDVNDQFAAMFGYRRDELIGSNARELAAPESRANVDEILASGSETVYKERALRKNGTTFVAEVRGRTTTWEGRQVRVVAVRDVTEQQRLQEALQRKNKELESVIYISSHDLRSPLVNIQGFSHRVQSGCAQLEAVLNTPEVPAAIQQAVTPIMRERIFPALGFILTSVLKMDGLLNGLLRLSRLGRADMRQANLDMKKAVTVAVDSLAFQIQNANATVIIGELPPCRGDATQVTQVISNLLDNALKYRDGERRLEINIRGRACGEECEYVVEDNGRGIDPRHQERIWEIFQRLDPTGPVKGEGLGLAIVLRILERHNGRVWVESGGGTTIGSRFYFTLPSALEQTEAALLVPLEGVQPR